MKKIGLLIFIFFTFVCCIFASGTELPEQTHFILELKKPSSIDLNFYADAECTTSLSEIAFSFASRDDTSFNANTTAKFYIKWRFNGENRINLSIVASSLSGKYTAIDDFCLVHEKKGEGNTDIGLNYQIGIKGISGSVISLASQDSVTDIASNDVTRDSKISLDKRSIYNFHTTNAGQDEGVLEVKLTAYAPKEKDGTGHAFLEGLHSGYINVILQSI